MYQLVKDGYVLQFANDKAIALFDLNKDMHLQHNLLTTNPTQAKNLELFLKAYIQTFNGRMVKNKLVEVND